MVDADDFNSYWQVRGTAANPCERGYAAYVIGKSRKAKREANRTAETRTVHFRTMFTILDNVFMITGFQGQDQVRLKHPLDALLNEEESPHTSPCSTDVWSARSERFW